MVAAGFSATLDKRQNLELVSAASVLLGVVVILAPKRLIGLNRTTAAHQAAAVLHSLADSVSHEPSRLVLDAQAAVELVRTDTLLAGTHQMDRQQPLVQRNAGPMEHGIYRNRELLAATLVTALVEAWTDFPARARLDRVNALHRATMDAHRAIRPADGLDVLTGGFFVCELRSGQIAHGYCLGR